MDVNEALEFADGSALPWAPVLAAEVRQLRTAVAFRTTVPDAGEADRWLRDIEQGISPGALIRKHALPLWDELDQLRAMKKRAREAYEAPDATMDERIVLRHVLGEQP